MADLRGCIRGSAGKTHILHRLKVRDIVSHIQHVLRVQGMVPGILPQDLRLVMDVEKNIRYSQIMQALPDSLGKCPRNHDDAISLFHGKLERITIPGAHSANLLTRFEYPHAAVCHDTIHVENKCPDRFKFFQYAHSGNTLLFEY